MALKHGQFSRKYSQGTPRRSPICHAMGIISFASLGGVSQALQNILSKFVYRYCRNHIYSKKFKLKLCTCVQSHALGTHTKFQLEILTINVIPGCAYFCENTLESLRNVSETTPWSKQLSWKSSDMSDNFDEVSLMSVLTLKIYAEYTCIVRQISSRTWKMQLLLSISIFLIVTVHAVLC